MDCSTGAIAISISIAALFIAVWEAAQSRAHNRRSLRPGVNIDYRRLIGEPFSISFTNHGSGPAVVRKVEIVLDGKHTYVADESGWRAALAAVGIPADIAAWLTVEPGSMFGPGHRCTLLEVRHQGGHTQQLAAALYKLKIRIQYESVYGDEMWNAS